MGRSGGGGGRPWVQSSNSRWRYLNPSYYLNRPKRLALLLIAFVVVTFVVWDRQTVSTADHLHQETNAKVQEAVHEELNYTGELLSATSFARQLVDQMLLAKAYVIIAKEYDNLKLAWEFSSHIRTCQRLLSKAAVRGQSITEVEARPLVSGLAYLINKAQDAHYDIATKLVTLRNHAQALEERAVAATVQSVYLARVASGAVPKNQYCLTVRLMVDWFNKPALKQQVDDLRNSPRLVDNSLYHFCIFSENVLASSAVVNSTVSNADHPQQLVFHIITSESNYHAMQVWFLSNDFKGSTIEVQKLEDFHWMNSSYFPVRNSENESDSKFSNPKYIPLLDHLKFYIPDIHPSLEKVIYLDDDVIVQKDLTPLFSLDLHGNVNGAVETCLEGFHRYHRYLNFSNPIISSQFDPQACGWAFGMNVFDLIAWKKANVTSRYRYWMEQNIDQTLWKKETLPVGLLSFNGLTEPLDRRWHVLGLGHDLGLDDRLIESAAVLHYDGYMKPWLELAYERYKPQWDRYVNLRHPYLIRCNAMEGK
ncbi:putative galacturonosyltransferase 11 [Acorus gramineus]|uniref:Hexosyltransferase n=1 Tax=Acorus gramineus TaxID=55184 RepID=A0AAV9A2B9_ACOGR|nr:putative galacturonosyltransferase 11 [Acorus gramineus]